jgi:hypothetical protein
VTERIERLPGEPEAIFIVGVSRSGTTLMRRVLDKHSRVGIATENHYLGHLLAWEGTRHYFRRLGDLHDDAAVRALVELIYSGELQRRSRLRELSPYWRWLTSRVPREDIEAYLLASDRSERGVFEAFLRIYADRRGKAVMGEKTPAHLGYVETLLEWFPGGRVVHCMRDPRAVYVSELRRRTEHAVGFPYRQLAAVPPLLAWFVLLEVVWAWARAVHRHRQLRRRYPDHYRLSRACWSSRSPPGARAWAPPASTPVRPTAGRRPSIPGRGRPSSGCWAGASPRWATGAADGLGE